MMGRPNYYEAGPNEGYGIAAGDDWNFEITPARNLGRDGMYGTYETRLEALESHLTGLENERVNLNRAIAKAKRLRRAWSKSGETA